LGAAEETSLAAAAAALVLVGTLIFVLTRRQEVLTRWLLRGWGGLRRLLRQRWSDEPPLRLAAALARGRDLFERRRLEMLLLVGIQLLSLTTQSLAMLAVLYSLGSHPSLFTVMAAFGITLITSTFNVLPGGGGTVEAALAITLQQLGVGDTAIAASLIFRLLNFWLLALPCLVIYHLLTRSRAS
jgi:uncharacterized protein (TIRG00374 family)